MFFPAATVSAFCNNRLIPANFNPLRMKEQGFAFHFGISQCQVCDGAVRFDLFVEFLNFIANGLYRLKDVEENVFP